MPHEAQLSGLDESCPPPSELQDSEGRLEAYQAQSDASFEEHKSENDARFEEYRNETTGIINALVGKTNTLTPVSSPLLATLNMMTKESHGRCMHVPLCMPCGYQEGFANTVA